MPADLSVPSQLAKLKRQVQHDRRRSRLSGTCPDMTEPEPVDELSVADSKADYASNEVHPRNVMQQDPSPRSFSVTVVSHTLTHGGAHEAALGNSAAGDFP